MSKRNVDAFSEEKISSIRHKTPYFLFSKKRLVANYKKFKELFPSSSIHYAMKANSENKILRTLRDVGSGFEVASVGELNMLKKLKVGPEKIIYGTSIKPHSHIKEFVSYGVSKFAADSFPELDKLGKLAPGRKVYIRTLVNDTGSIFKFSEKFGTEAENIVSYLLHAKKIGLVPFGISFHVGSQASDEMAWSNAISGLKPILKKLKDKGIWPITLDIGGGYPCRYSSSENVPELSEIAKHINSVYNKLINKPKLILEPGRGIVADTGILVASIIAIVERKGNRWIFLDAGVYNGLFETMAYQGSTRYSVTSLRPIGDAGASMFAIAGPTGDSPDVITREALLPADIEVDDKLIFHNAGAYSISVTSEFNGFKKPKTYFV